MPSKKPTKPRFHAKRNGKGFRGLDKKSKQPLPDTSRIPWCKPVPPSGTDD